MVTFLSLILTGVSGYITSNTKLLLSQKYFL